MSVASCRMLQMLEVGKIDCIQFDNIHVYELHFALMHSKGILRKKFKSLDDNIFHIVELEEQIKII